MISCQMARTFFVEVLTFVVIKLLFMSVNPFSVSNLCLLLITAGLLTYLLFLWRMLKQKSTPEAFATFRKPVLTFVSLYALYFTGISFLAANQFFNVITMPPRFLLIFLPLLLIVILLSRASLRRSLRFLHFVPPVLLIAIHVYRFFIELVFVEFAKDKIIPVELSIHGRNFDLWIGVLALPVAYLFLKGHKLARKAGIAFNVLGLLSLVNIFTIAVPSMPSPFRVYNTLYLPTYFPGISIVFLASAAIFLHILSLRQLSLLWNVEPLKNIQTKKLKKALLPQ